MLKSLVMRLVLFICVLPAAVSAAALDDYYLSRFGEQVVTPRALVQSVGAAPHAVRCLTPLYHSLRKDWNQLQPSTQTVLARRLLRPTLPASYISPGGHFNIHYAISGSDAPAPVDVTGPSGYANGMPDWVDTVAAVFDHVYTAEVTQMGYRPPPGARYDIYIKDMTLEQAYGITQVDVGPVKPAVSADSYIEVDKSYTDSMFNDATYQGLGQPAIATVAQQMLEVTAAHEFHHAIQYGYNYYMDLWYGEATSTWIEDELYDSVNQLYGYLQDYLPKTNTLPLDAPIDGSSEYGRWIFNRQLSESHPGLPYLIRDIWARVGATAAPADINSDIAMVPVIDAVLKANGGSFAQDLLQFAKNLYLRKWNTHTDEISQIPEVTQLGSQWSYPVNMTPINQQIAVLPTYAFGYYRFLPSGSAPAILVLTFANVPATVDVVAIKKNTDGTTSEYAIDRYAGTVTVPAFNAPATQEVVLVICNSGTTTTPPGGITSVPSSNKGGGCFIATAAWGSYLHPKVALLRDFRDRHLLTNAPGRLFVALYYRISPPIAKVIAGHAWMRGAVRVLLTPVVLSVEYPLVALLILITGAALLVWRLARRRLPAESASMG